MKFTAFPRLLFNQAAPEAPPAGGGGGPASATPPAPAPAQAAPPANTPASIFNADNTFTADWYTKLGDEFTPHAATLERFNSPGDLAKSYLHLRASGTKYPGADSTPDDITRFREAAQVPADPAGYGLKAPENLPQGVQWDPAVADRLAAIAHKYHIPAPALQALAAEQLAIEAERATGYAAEQTKAEESATKALIDKWGGDFEQNAGIVRHLTESFAASAGLHLDANALQRLTANPDFALIMHSVSRHVGEDRVRTPATFGDLRTPGQRAKDIAEGRDKEHSEKYSRGDIATMEMVGKLIDEQAALDQGKK